MEERKVALGLARWRSEKPKKYVTSPTFQSGAKLEPGECAHGNEQEIVVPESLALVPSQQWLGVLFEEVDMVDGCRVAAYVVGLGLV